MKATTELFKNKKYQISHRAFIMGIFAMAWILLACSPKNTSTEEWIQLFNGKNLDGWTVKITGHDVGDNYANTFRVEDGILKASYDDYDQFDNRFGHLFYEKPFSSFKLRVEYRIVGEQMPGGPSWGNRNNGVMFHSQSPESMEIDQNFPTSIEAQLLSNGDDTNNTNGNVCTPGTIVEIDGEDIQGHCFSSGSKQYYDGDWITFELVVYEDSIAHHIIEGDTVLTYSNIRLDNGSPLSEGYIAIQAESHPTEFRLIEIMELGE
ncbi:MAG TPA: DUF1080 domain-containing protein [Prolixibacteraceae bacterium]|nr:DUF1080 domain-containing protein [Prolixibacteraceae bacterium]